MAYLIEQNSHSPIHLFSHHSFGRLAQSVNTLVNKGEVSRIHAVVEWEQNQWKLVDLSRNGTWLNDQKLEKDRYYTLKEGDVFCLAQANSNSFCVKDISPPSDLLVALENPQPSFDNIIPLKPYNLIPNEEAPEIAIYMDNTQTHWCTEAINQADVTSRILKENDLISFAGKRWQLRIDRSEAQTIELKNRDVQFDQIEFVFQLSMDEELTSLVLHTPNGKIDLDTRTHHYLSLNLARYKAQDIAQGLNESEQGWIYADQLAKDLGLAETHMNIQIHRARKQFTNAVDSHASANDYIQRQGGKIRLGVTNFKVYKGGETECCSQNEWASTHQNKTLTIR